MGFGNSSVAMGLTYGMPALPAIEIALHTPGLPPSQR
jgi:hypothetical protein